MTSNVHIDIINIQEADGKVNHYSDKNVIVCNIENLTKSLNDEYAIAKYNLTNDNDAVVELLEHISSDKEKTNNKLFIISAAYDKVYHKYYGMSLAILILSAFVTLIEALRLSIVDFINHNTVDAINTEHVSFIMNVLTLSIGTVITLLSSIIRFKNYRETLEQLKDKQNLLITFRDKYNKKYNEALKLLATNSLTMEDIKHIDAKLTEYDNNIKSINILEHLRNEQLLAFNQYKAYFDFNMEKIKIDKKVAIKKYKDKFAEVLNDNP